MYVTQMPIPRAATPPIELAVTASCLNAEEHGSELVQFPASAVDRGENVSPSRDQG